ncbi:indole-3-glycerol phosphate synthase TrpC [Archaeoglobales archaeon]|nr:MAG: indole-3-glycerol phosphate synthase TrpC [Archaeoglobales archaeon]
MIKLYKNEVNPIIAEIKVYSPKHGDLLGKRDPIEIMEIYERCGVVGISYITAKEFKGDFELFRRICEGSNLPVLRKDFVMDKHEIEKTAEVEASAILLIARFLKDKTSEFVDYSLEHGLETLVEVHSIEDVAIAKQTKTTMIGINNRDITKLEKDDGSVCITEKLCNYLPNRVLRVSESGIRTIDDLRRALRVADAALIGTAFMVAEDVEKVVKEFVKR